MAHAQYLIVLGLCVLVTLPLEFLLGARVYRSPRRLLTAVLPVFVVLVCWDLLAVARGHWSYDARFVTGVRIGTLPIEELLFFLVIPICALLTFEAVGRVGALLRGTGPIRLTWPEGLSRANGKPRASAGSGAGEGPRA